MRTAWHVDPGANAPARILFGLLIACVLVLALPPPVLSFKPGLDPSWQWALNALAFSTSGVGQAAFFTYGPLGFALYPGPAPLNAGAALFCNLSFIGLWLALLGYAAFSLKMSREGILCLLLCFLLPLSADGRWSVLTVALISAAALLPTAKRTPILVFSALAGYVGVLTSLFKFNLAITTVLTFCAAAFFLLMFERRRLLLVLPAFALAAFVALLAARAVFFGSFAEMARWASLSWKISEGYNQSMATPLDFAFREILFVLAFLGTYGALGLFRESWSLRRAALFLPLIPLFFLTYKHNITRAGCGTSRILVCVVPFATALLALFADAPWRRRLRWLFLFQWAVGLAIFNLDALRGKSPVLLGLSLRNVRDTVCLGQTLSKATDDSARNLAPLALPEAWRQAVSTNSFQSIPLELTYAPANGFAAVPFPLLQGYSAYRHDLDTFAARLYESPRAPSHILFTWESVDQRHPLLDTPAVWSAILAHYRLALHDGRKALLQRQGSAPVRTLTPLADRSVRQGEWLELPTVADGELCVSADWPQTGWGRIVTLLFRNTRCRITLAYDDGSLHEFRVVPDTLRTPFPTRWLLPDMAAFTRQLEARHDSGPRVTRLKLECDHPAFYRSAIAVRLHAQAAPLNTP